CETPACGKPAKLQCPTCIKLNISGSFFCEQTCFKANWKTHKQVHKKVEKATTDEIDRIVHEATIERNCYPSPLNYYTFPKSCCTSVNEVICHGIPDKRPLDEGDIVNLDITCYYDGFHADLNETLFVGKVDDDSKRLVQTAYDSLMAAVNEVKPGVRYRDLGKFIQKVAQDNGCSVTRTYCGHGIHRLFHTAPNVPHYAKNKAVGIMKPGHVFTIEPMINLGSE
uniref:Methionine aminopeptidase n=1 Tax=Clytia hemisphaerica TaxID=252671 RepID=A0A7M5WXM5_9CNID